MINIFINNAGYGCPTTWEDITLGQAVRLDALAEKLPGDAKDALAVAYEPSASREEDDPAARDTLEGFGKEMFGILCNVPDHVVQATDPGHIRLIVEKYLLPFAAGLIFEPDYTPRQIRSFPWNGETLMLPGTEVDLAGIAMPMADRSAIELCEASDLYNADRIAQAAMIIAALCRPEGETYNERRAKERARGMEALPMSVAIEVFFCLPQRTVI